MELLEGKDACMTLSAFAVLLLVIYYVRTHCKRYPSGPRALPFIGNLHQIRRSKSIVNFCEQNRKIYGDVFTIEIGGTKRVVVSGYKAMHELLILHADCTSTRSIKAFTKTIQEDSKVNPGLVWAPFPQWKNIRKFAFTELKKEGMGKSIMELQILEEIDQYTSTFIQPNLSKPINMHLTLPQATCNIISQLVFGRRFEYNDEEFNRMMRALNESMGLISQATTLRNIPFISFLMKSVIMREQHLKRDVMIPTIRKYIEEHKKSLDPAAPRDLIDKLLIAANSQHGFSESNAAFVSFHLYAAGSETTATTLRWALLFMCKHPDIKRIVQLEIDEQIGLDHAASYKDHLHMPYTDAVLMETMRISNVVATSLPHYTSADIFIDGKMIPADTEILLNMASVLHDETVFEDPTKFKPERYLTGNIALKKQRTIPFGIGKRACLGESLAKMELFLFFVTLMQKYDVCLPPESAVTTDPVTTLLNMPQSYDILFSPRGYL